MKNLITIITVAAALALATMASAEQMKNPAGAYSVQIFTNYTGYGLGGATTRYSLPVKVDRNTKKTVMIQGYSTGTTEAASFTGTAAVQCGLSSAGPWAPLKDMAANAVTGTTGPLVFDSDGLCQWVRGTYLKASAGAPNISMWILYGD
jgi:hypothetical protein